MKNRLLNAVLVVCSKRQASGPAVIDDVVRHADVSRGTFYKYFISLDQAVAELGARLADEMTAGIYPVYDVLEHPVERAATGFLLFLVRAVVEPTWGAFVSHIGLLSSDSLLFRHMSTDIRRGATCGHFKVTNLEAASDFVLGVQIEAIRRLIRGEQREEYILSMAGMNLRSLGVTAAQADKAVRLAYDRLCEQAPAHIAWWREIG